MDKKIFRYNLNNIEKDKNLFGEEIPKLSVKNRIGFIPISVWQPNWKITKDLKKFIGDAGQARQIKTRSRNYRGLGWSFRDLGKRKDGVDRSMSIFNPDLAIKILSAYCPQNANIYDPFGGGGTRGFIARMMDYNYTGLEIRQEEVERIKEKQKELNLFFDIILQDSTNYAIKEDYFDFSYTCPPYFNLEVYSDMEEDLSALKTYEEFLKKIKDVLEITYLGLKNNSLAVWVIGNFRDKYGNLIHFNGDLVKLAKEVGFVLHNELIFWGASNACAQRAGQFVANRRSIKVHEYILIFKKP